MMRTLWPWLGLLALGLLPWLLLMALGGYWLSQNGQFLHWFWLAVAATGAAWVIGLRMLERVAPLSPLPPVEPDRLWSPEAEAAWAKVEALVDTLKPEDYPFSDPARLLPLARRIIVEVARHFRPGAKRAELDAPLPSLLLILERVSHDMREILTEQVPASHLITVGDGLTLWRWKENLAQMGAFARVGKMVVNPVGGLLNELRIVFFKRASRYTMAELERWLLHTLALKIGYYAILLYSGQLRLDSGSADQPTPASSRDLDAATRAEEHPAEPLRVLVVGQTKAGKSSLINALFGEVRAPADALPATDRLTPYRLEREGEFLGLVFDSPGIGDDPTCFEAIRAELPLIDLILLVCSATHAGRAADARFLETLHACHALTPDRLPPPVVVALTHIDLLRPLREWNPPYNVAEPDGAKASQIRHCMDEVAHSLGLPLQQVQALCLKPGAEWNIEALWAGIACQLPQARRAQYLRCLKDRRAREKWALVLRQLNNTGRLIASGLGKLWPQ